MQWVHDRRLSALRPSIYVSDLSAGSSRELKEEAGDVPAGRKYGGGTPWREILWDGYKCDFFSLVRIVSVQICARLKA